MHMMQYISRLDLNPACLLELIAYCTQAAAMSPVLVVTGYVTLLEKSA